MLQEILSAMTVFIIRTISTLGYVGVFFLMALQTVAIPMPSEVIIPFAGFLAVSGRFNLLILAIVGGLGSCLGASVAYWIGTRGGRPLVEQYGRMILISRHDLNTADLFFSRFGTWAVFFGQLLPVVRSFIAFPAGISRVPYKKFVSYTFIGSFIWCLLLAFIGQKLGENWGSLRDRFKSLDIIIIVLIALGIIWWGYRHLKNRLKISA